MPTSNWSTPLGKRAMSSRRAAEQAVGHHLEVQEQARAQALEEEAEDRGRGAHAQVEGAVDELEGGAAALQQRFHGRQEALEGE